MKYLKLFEIYKYEQINNNFYFTTKEGLEYKIIFNDYNNTVRIDMAVWDDNLESYSFDVIPNKIVSDELFSTLLFLIKEYNNKIKSKFSLYPNSYTKFRLYKIKLSKIKEIKMNIFYTKENEPYIVMELLT